VHLHRDQKNDPAPTSVKPPAAAKCSDCDADLELFANQALAQWAANIADRIKNPVAGISAAIDIIEKQFYAYSQSRSFDDAVMAKAIDLTRARLEILDQYVSDVVTVAQPAKVTPRIIDPQSLINQVVEDTLAHSTWTGHIGVSIDPDVKWISCDPEKMTVLLKALVTNSVEAVEASQEPNLSISVQYLKEDDETSDADEPKTVAISVCDNGHGIDQDRLQRVKLPFFTTKEARAGFGMALVEKIAIAHGGRITLSKCDKLQGAQVSVLLPANPSAASKNNAMNSGSTNAK